MCIQNTTPNTETALLEEALSLLVEAFKSAPTSLSQSSGDGRLDSATNEAPIVKRIETLSHSIPFFATNGLKIGTPNLNTNNNREWYDFAIESADTSVHNYFMPVNVKITNMNTKASDNLSCKLGIFYALTGLLPKSVALSNTKSWDDFMSKCDVNMGTYQHRDYYFFVVNKQDVKDAFWNSLRCLPSLVPNGNNLPFQCKWADSRVRIERDYFEARDFILSCLKKSIKQRIEIGPLFDKHLDKYIGTKLVCGGGASI